MYFIKTFGLLGLALTSSTLAGPTAGTTCSGGGSWETLASIPNPRQECGVAAICDSTIAVVGGTRMDGILLKTINLTQLYDIASDTWKTVADLPIEVNHPNVAAVGNKLYVLGGLVDGPPVVGSIINWQASGDSFVYDMLTDEWSELPSMPPGTERGSAVTLGYGTTIYLAGGMTVLTQYYQDAVDSVIAFDTISNTWQRLPAGAAEIPQSRQHAAGGIVDNIFLLTDGRRYSQTNVFSTIFELDLLNLSAGWTVSPTHFPTARGGISGGAVGSTMYTFGGEGDPNTTTGVFPQVESFDLTTGQTASLGDMPVPRHGTQAAVAGGKIYIPGGGLQQDGKVVVTNGTIMFGNPTNYFSVFTPC